jgi:hypothetical protein
MPYLRLTFLFALLNISANCLSQDYFFVTGRVIDAKTRESLAFVNIVVNNSNIGGTTDDGNIYE